MATLGFFGDGYSSEPGPSSSSKTAENPDQKHEEVLSNTSSEPRRDTSFYFEPVTFRVENTLFKVPKSGFMVPGTTFEAMFSLPSYGNAVEGGSDKNPIHLQGIDEGKFRSFLKILYPPNSFSTTAEMSYEDLVNALDLASFWVFTKLQKEIISALTPMIDKRSDTEVIFIAKKYSVESWLRSVYKKLSFPSFQLSVEALRSSTYYALDWETIAKICNIRETIMMGAMGNSSTVCSACKQSYGPGQAGPQRYSCDCRVAKLVDERFQKELQMMGGLVDSLDPPIPVFDDNLGSTGSKGKKKVKRSLF